MTLQEMVEAVWFKIKDKLAEKADIEKTSENGQSYSIAVSGFEVASRQSSESTKLRSSGVLRTKQGNDYNYSFPNKSGTFAMQDDIPDLDNYLTKDGGQLNNDKSLVAKKEVISPVGRPSYYYAKLTPTDVEVRSESIGGVLSNKLTDSGFVHSNPAGEYTNALPSKGGALALQSDVDSINNNLVQEEQEIIDLKMLGYTVPKEMPVQNYVDANGQYHQKVMRVDLSLLKWNTASYGYYSTDLNTLVKHTSKDTDTPNLYSEKYIVKNAQQTSSSTKGSNYITISPSGAIAVSSSDTPIGYAYYELATEKVFNVDGHEISNSITDLKMLGWSVPKECPIQNTVNGNNFVQRVGRVDLGELGNYTYDAVPRFYISLPGAKKPANNNLVANIYCVIYRTASITELLNNSSSNKVIALSESGNINIKDSSYTDANTFKSAMKGKYLYYELATEIVIPMDGNEKVVEIEENVANNQLNPLDAEFYRVENWNNDILDHTSSNATLNGDNESFKITSNVYVVFPFYFEDGKTIIMSSYPNTISIFKDKVSTRYSAVTKGEYTPDFTGMGYIAFGFYSQTFSNALLFASYLSKEYKKFNGYSNIMLSNWSANSLRYTGTNDGVFTVYQTSDEYYNESGWATYLIGNHGNGSSYYHQMIRLPFWGAPQYQRMEGGELKGWQTFITTENIASIIPAQLNWSFGQITSGSYTTEKSGLNIYQTSEESSGIQFNGDYISMWSPCDSYSIRYFDEDNGQEVWNITGNGKFSGSSKYVSDDYLQLYSMNTNKSVWENPGISSDGVVLASYSASEFYLHPVRDNACRLGSPSERYTNLFAVNSAISTSDRNLKSEISYIGEESVYDTSFTDEQLCDLIMGIKPAVFHRSNGDGQSNRPHHGLIAQDFEELLYTIGLNDHAGFIKSQKTIDVEYQNENGETISKLEPIENEYIYGFRYEELITDLIRFNQILKNEIDELKQEIQTMKTCSMNT